MKPTVIQLWMTKVRETGNLNSLGERIRRKSLKRRERRKRKSDEKKKSEEKKKDKENPDAMEEEVPDEAGRGTTKRARIANEASDEENNGKDKLLKELADQKELMRQLFGATKTREAQYEERLVKKDKEIVQLRAEITELKDAMVKSQKQVVDRLDVLMEAQAKPPMKLPKPTTGIFASTNTQQNC
uniref:Vicilin-like seed storage protein At2g18540 n=1 Tax=Diabrotica virgifera virgifera TaxID=50390 RepID=A0A6P7GJ16_DIAVI